MSGAGGWAEAGPHALTLLGTLVLARPVVSLNRRRRAQTRLEDRLAAAGEGDQPAILRELGGELVRRRQRGVARWRRIDEVCLYAGYAMVLGAALWRTLAAF